VQRATTLITRILDSERNNHEKLLEKKEKSQTENQARFKSFLFTFDGVVLTLHLVLYLRAIYVLTCLTHKNPLVYLPPFASKFNVRSSFALNP